jgi:hypothetical protein
MVLLLLKTSISWPGKATISVYRSISCVEKNKPLKNALEQNDHKNWRGIPCVPSHPGHLHSSTSTLHIDNNVTFQRAQPSVPPSTQLAKAQ